MNETATPPDWSFNPSSWSQRVPLILWTVIGFAIAFYLTLFQVDWIRNVWEPFFGDGSRVILNSEVSHLLPVPDAALGAFGYLVDAATGAVGGQKRWRTMPWMVILFGFAAGPMGLVGILLVILQPVLYDAWCTMCLASAVISVGIMSPSIDESLASLQYLKREKQRGRSIWRAFWGIGKGSESEMGAGEREDPRFNWVQSFGVLTGVWLMFAPSVLEYAGKGRINDLIVGPIAASFAVMALWEFMVSVKWVNLPLGFWLLSSAFLIHGPGAGRTNAIVCGLLISAFAALPATHRPHLFGGGWSSLCKKS